MFGLARKEQLSSLAGVILLHALLGWLILSSLASRFVDDRDDALDVFDVRPAPLPPVMPPPQEIRTAPSATAPGPAGAAAPAPRPEPARQIAPDVSPPVAAGIVPSVRGETSALSGNPQWMIDGAGGGGRGSGSGAGTAGSGYGGGGAVARARLRGGRIGPRDYPRAAAGHQGAVTAHLEISVTGIVTGCSITRSSGSAVLDATTCRLIRERFRYTPARDAQGRAVPDVTGWQQRWWRD